MSWKSEEEDSLHLMCMMARIVVAWMLHDVLWCARSGMVEIQAGLSFICEARSSSNKVEFLGS